MLRPTGDAGVGEALMPMLMTQAIESLENLPEKISPDMWLQATTAEYARHLRDFPLDILKAACDTHVRSGSQFFPKVFELTRHAQPALDRRRAEATRVDRLIEHARRPVTAAFEAEPKHITLLTVLKWQERPGSSLHNPAKAAVTRRELATLAEDERIAAVTEGRPVEEWATVDYLAGIDQQAVAPALTAQEATGSARLSERSHAVTATRAAHVALRQAGFPLRSPQPPIDEPPPPTEEPYDAMGDDAP